MLPTEPGSVIEAKPPGRKKPFLMALQTNGWWRRLDIPVDESGPFREVRVLFDAGEGSDQRSHELDDQPHRSEGEEDVLDDHVISSHRSDGSV